MGFASAVASALQGTRADNRRRYIYSAIPLGEAGHNRGRQRTWRVRPLKVLAAFVIAAAALSVVIAYRHARGATREHADTSSQSWGQYSPFFSVPSAIDASTPDGCEVTFAAVLSRHGSRYPTASKAEVYRLLLDRVQKSVSRYARGYEFIEDFALDPGVDSMTSYGENELVESGIAFYQRYKLLARDSDPFIRASGSDRVIMSAQNFTQGFYRAQGKSYDGALEKILVLPEGTDFNNTLDHGTCPAFENGPNSAHAREKQKVWGDIWATPIRERLNSKLPGAGLTVQDTIFMMDLCPFDTVATAGATMSMFCGLFSADEWHGYDYFGSLGKWYQQGNGSPLGPTQGAGYANELIARLTGQAVRDSTTTNSTLDSSPETFPLDRKLYADFSHDNAMVSAYAALGLYGKTDDLPVTSKLPPLKAHGFSASWTVPFAGRMYVEKMRCGGEGDEELVRIIINDRVQGLDGCGADHLGRCKLGAFVKSLSFARRGGRWNGCYS